MSQKVPCFVCGAETEVSFAEDLCEAHLRDWLHSKAMRRYMTQPGNIEYFHSQRTDWCNTRKREFENDKLKLGETIAVAR